MKNQFLKMSRTTDAEYCERGLRSETRKCKRELSLSLFLATGFWQDQKSKRRRTLENICMSVLYMHVHHTRLSPLPLCSYLIDIT